MTSKGGCLWYTHEGAIVDFWPFHGAMAHLDGLESLSVVRHGK